MLNFKAQLERDVKAVFHNSREFAEKTEIEYDGNFYNIPVVLDYEGAADRKKPSADHADGIFLVDLVLYIAFSDLKVVPKMGHTIEVKGDLYRIVKVGNENGEIVLDLEMFDE